jgi:thiamine-phosphate pyrophosphorylase
LPGRLGLDSTARQKLRPAEIRRLAAAILPILREAGVGLVINDHYDIARESARIYATWARRIFSTPVTRASPNWPPNLPRPGDWFEHPCPEQAMRALAAGPAYIAIGPVYATGTKPGAKPVTLEYVRWAASHVTIPWFAIGGINLAKACFLVVEPRPKIRRAR